METAASGPPVADQEWKQNMFLSPTHIVRGMKYVGVGGGGEWHEVALKYEEYCTVRRCFWK
jgi:hypothetical protein